MSEWLNPTSKVTLGAPSAGDSTQPPAESGASVTNVSKTYGATRAVRDVTLSIAPGEIVGLIGENGSGKSTLARIWSGVERPDRGTITVHGTDIAGAGLAQATRLGIGIVFQELSFLPSVTLIENLFATAPEVLYRYCVYRKRYARRLARKILAEYGISSDTDILTARLAFGVRQLAEVARALEVPKLISPNVSRLAFLDEATTSLGHQEVRRLFERMRAAATGEQASYVFVSHRLQEVLDICDRIAVMRDGHLVDTLPVAEATERRLHQLMTGREPKPIRSSSKASASRRTALDAGGFALEVKGLSGRGFQNVSLIVRRGEIVGLAGTESSGKAELLGALYGEGKIGTGSVTIGNQSIRRITPRAQIGRRVIYLPRERLTGSVIVGFSIARNIALNDKIPTIVRSAGERNVANKIISHFRVMAYGPNVPIASLSGGNQQKVAIGKWLEREPRLLLLDNPTRGVDVGSREDIYDALSRAVREDGAVLLASDELEELVAICDRVYVMRGGWVSSHLDLSESHPDAESAVGLEERSRIRLDAWRERIVAGMV